MTERSESINELAAALAKAQSVMGAAHKSRVNPAFKSKYADLASVWDACREPLSSNGLSVVQMPVDAEPGRVALTTLLLHASGQYISSTVSTRLVKDDPQGVGSALSYLRRYALASMVGIVADDDDGNAASGQAERQPMRGIQPRAQVVQEHQPQPPAAPDRTKLIARINALYRQANERGINLPVELLAAELEHPDTDLIELGRAIKAYLEPSEVAA